MRTPAGAENHGDTLTASVGSRRAHTLAAAHADTGDGGSGRDAVCTTIASRRVAARSDG